MNINTCISNLDVSSSSTDANPCEDYCAMFNPVTYHRHLEGDLNKYYAYSMTIKNLSQKLQSDYDEDNKKKEDVVQASGRLLESQLKKLRQKYKKTVKKSKGRILSSTTLSHESFDADGKMDEEVNVISQFNKEFKTALIKPIAYKFEEDTSIRNQIDYKKSIFTMGLEKYFNLPEFKSTVKSEGINFYSQGESAQITKNNAIKVFQNSDPANANATGRELTDWFKNIGA